MADKEEEASSGGDNTTPRGTVDWEVVSLTASAYAASPGPKPVDDDNKDVTPPPSSGAETSHPLYMSGHFVFPPSSEEHHNTNMEPSEIYEDKKASKKMDSDFSLEQEDTPGKEVGAGDLSSLKGDELSGLDFFEQEEEDKGKSNIYKTSMQDERAFGGSHVYEQTEPVTDITPDDQLAAANSPPPCEPWWKRSAASLISQAKETNTVWSIFIAAAAVMGVVVLGQRWQHERWQLLQLNWESTIANNEKAGRLMGPISRLKQAFVGGQRRDSFIRASSQNDS
ncbi:ATG8-interacting protein 2 [Hirschfeldia incana]|nr:ATG8-interacting protein 2 [Hirschfeldia incana]KAJ0250015.1 ATG8-interacting protein 2 [Hirschfeldia incana]KAJ0250016.1 ATG8-interacting protein 2 [Hirschfeldia incana]KAJ0250017.1 ATG8-interacting protein 2 [Hirschfeldia incana]